MAEVKSIEQTVAIIKAVGEAMPEAAVTPEPQSWLIPLAVTIIGGIATTIFGVWYSKKRRGKKHG